MPLSARTADALGVGEFIVDIEDQVTPRARGGRMGRRMVWQGPDDDHLLQKALAIEGPFRVKDLVENTVSRMRLSTLMREMVRRGDAEIVSWVPEMTYQWVND